MPFYSVKKWQSGEDAHGDGFVWREETLTIESPSMEVLKSEIKKVDGAPLYSNEFLRLEFGEECAPCENPRSLRDYVSSYPHALAQLNE